MGHVLLPKSPRPHTDAFVDICKRTSLLTITFAWHFAGFVSVILYSPVIFKKWSSQSPFHFCGFDLHLLSKSTVTWPLRRCRKPTRGPCALQEPAVTCEACLRPAWPWRWAFLRTFRCGLPYACCLFFTLTWINISLQWKTTRRKINSFKCVRVHVWKGTEHPLWDVRKPAGVCGRLRSAEPGLGEAGEPILDRRRESIAVQGAMAALPAQGRASVCEDPAAQAACGGAAGRRGMKAARIRTWDDRGRSWMRRLTRI